MSCRYVARPFAMIGARSSRYSVFFSPHLRARELARSRANSQTSNLPPNRHILARHRSTAELRVVGIETSRTESLTEKPFPESNDLAMSRLRIRETIISPCVGLAPLLSAFTRNSQTHIIYMVLQSRSMTYQVWQKKGTAVHNSTATGVHNSTAVIAHGFWAHIGCMPWATSKSTTSQPALR